MPKNGILSLFLSVFFLFSRPIVAQDTDSYFYLKSGKNLTVDKDLSDFSVSYYGDSSNISVINFAGNYDKQINNSLNIEARQAVTQEFYRNQPDKYDFLVIFTKFPVDSGEAAAFAVSYENDVNGIGIPIFDNSSVMGSERLQTTIDMTEITDWELNPGKKTFDTTLGTLMHEMMHRWGIHVKFMDDNNQISDLTLGRDSVHWNYFLNTNASLMYGSFWQDKGNNLFETKSIRQSLSPLDLYLMGFKDASSVPDFFLISSGVPGDREDIPSPVGTQASGMRVDISVNDIIAAEGERYPSSINAQHKFNFKFILLKSYEQEVDADDIGRLIVLQREFQKRFYAETGGIGEIVYSNSSEIGLNGDPNGLSFDPINKPAPNLVDAESFLVNSQIIPQGYWADKVATKVRDTALAVKALQLFDTSQSLNLGITWLNEYDAINNDELAWQLLSGVLNSTKKNEVANLILENINDDGGWGFNASSESSPYDSALVLWALLEEIPSYSPSSNTRLYINNHLNSNSGVGYSAGGVSSLSSSAMFLNILYELTLDLTAEQELINFIVNLQHPNGGFGVKTPSSHETALVINALNQAHNQNNSQNIGSAITELATQQSIDGSFEGSVYSTALASIILMDDSRPNIKLVSANISNNNPVAGEVVTVDYRIQLVSEQSIDNLEVSVFQQNNVTNSEILSVLNPNEILNSSIALDTTGFSGNYSFTLKVDSNNNYIENNEFDNEFNFDLNVIEQSSTPELTFDWQSITYQPKSIDQLPEIFDLQFDVINLSSTSLQNVDVSLFKRIDSGSMLLLSTEIIDINSNQAINVQFNEEISDSFSDSLQFIIKIDKDNHVFEVNELNNEHVIDLNKVLVQDIEILSNDIVVPSSVYVGIPVIFEYTVRNTGTVVSPAFNLAVFKDDGNSVTEILSNTVGPIEAGGVKTLQFEIMFDEVGSYDVLIVLDNDNLISEANESNNTGTASIVVQENNLTNLSVHNTGIQFSLNPGLEGRAAGFSIEINNTSTVASGPFDLALFAIKPNEPPFVLATVNGLNSLAAGETHTEEIIVSELNFNGQVELIVSIDPDEMIDEFNETDNIAFVDYSVLSMADAVVSSGGINLNPTIPVINENLSVKVAVSNSGEQDIGNINANLYVINSLTQSQSLVASDGLTSLSAGETSFFIFNFNFPNDNGIDQIKVEVDENNLITEGREDNNSAKVVIDQQDSDFYLSTLYFSPNGDGQKDNVQIVFNLVETDNYQISIRNSLNQLVRQFDYSQFTQTTFGDVNWDGRGADGKILPDGQYNIHIIGENTSYENELNVWLDTNRYSMAETLKNDLGILFDLNCLVNETYDKGVFSLDGKYLYIYSYEDKNSQSKNGVFRIKTDGSEIKPMLPNSFTDINRVEDLYISRNGTLIFKTINQSNNIDLWSLNPKTLGLSQLMTGGIENFDIFDFTNDYLSIRHYENAQYNFNHISLNPSTPPEPIQLQPHAQSYNDVNRVSNGWVWLVLNSDVYNVYFKADTGNYGSELLNAVAERNNLKISDDKNYFLLELEDSLYLYRVGEGSVVTTHLTDGANLYDSFSSFFSPKNHVVTVTDQVKIFDHFGSEITRVNHKYNYDYFVQQIIENYGSTENLIIHTEMGEITYALSDLENLSISTDSLRYAWADNEDLYISFSAKLEGDLNISEGYYETVSFYDNSNDSVNKRINYKNISQIQVLNLDNTLVNYAPYSEADSLYFSMGSNVYGKTLKGEPPEFTSEFLDDYSLINLNPQKNSSSIINKLLVKNYNSNKANSCTPVFGNERAIFQSKQNLTTFISANFFDGSVEISGSVFDQFLAQYLIEWKRNDQTSSDWNYIMSGQLNQVNQLFNYWIPPAPGIYTLRLSAYDRAENSIFDEVEVVVGELNTTIKNIDISPRYISPNFDGVQDELNFEYDLVKPVNILIEIRNDAGSVVKSILRNYSVGMVNDQFQWDGRGDNGQILPDGKYLVAIEGMNYPITFDTTEPNVELQVTQVLAESCCFDSKLNAQVKVKVPLNGVVDELDELMTYIERYDFSSGDWVGINNYIYVNPYNFDSYRNLLLRGRAIDNSGNVGFTQEVPVEIDKAVSVDIRRIVNLDGNTKVHKAALRDSGISVKEIDIKNYPEITNPTFSDYLGITIQTKSFQTIQSIEMKTTHSEVVDGTNVEIENIVPLNLSNLELAQAYFQNGTLVEVNGDSNLFRLSNEEGDFYLNFIQVEQAAFPNTTSQIDVELKITYTDTVINHLFKINFQSQNVVFDFFKSSKKNPLYLNSGFAPIAYEAMETAVFGAEGISDLWFFSEVHSGVYNPVVKIYNIETGGFIDQLELHYEEISNNYVSQYFKWEHNCLEGSLVVYQGIDTEGNLIKYQLEVNSCPPASYYKVWFDTGAYCDNNAPVDPTLRIQFETALPNYAADFPPYKLDVFVESATANNFLVYSEENPVLYGGIFHDIDIEINKVSFNGGLYKFKSIFYFYYSLVDANGNITIKNKEEEYYFYSYIENQKAVSQIIEPTQNQKICAVDSVEGRFIPVDFISTLSTNSPYQHSFAQILNGDLMAVQVEYDGLETVIEYEEENNFKLLKRNNHIINTQLNLFADPDFETTTLLHEVTNSTGVSYCSEVEFEVDAKLEAEFQLMEGLLFDNRLLLSPDGDGMNDLSDYAELIAGEEISVNIELFEKTTDTSLGLIASYQLIEDESLLLNWDGRLNGTTVDDGAYYIKVTFFDSCLLTESVRIDVIIDTVAPVVDFNIPMNGQEIGFITDVVGSVVETNLEFVGIEYFYNNVWSPIPTEAQLITAPDLHEITARLNLMGLPQGTYSLKMFAMDLLGHHAETIIDVMLPVEQNIFWNYALSPQYISPNNDAIQDQTTLDLGLNIQSNLIIDVQDIGLTTVQQIETGASYVAGSHQITWDGTNSTGQPVPDGIYQLRTQAAEVGQPTNTETISVNVTVDNTFPVTTFSVADASVIKGEGNVQFTVAEANLKELAVYEQTIDPMGPENQISNDLQTGTFDVLSLADLSEHTHQLRTVAKDKAGNLTTVSVQFEIDNTVPVVSLLTPEDLDFVGSNAGAITFTGEIIEKNLSRYELFISPNVEPVQWQSIYTGTSLQENQFNHDWPISVVDGAYLIKVLVIDQAGWEAEVIHEVTIDRQPPEVEISLPISGSLNGKNISIQGTANDDNFNYFHLSYQIATSHSNNAWQLIHTGIEPVINNFMYDWTHDLESGVYRLRLLAEDKVGLISETITEIDLDTEAPETPLYLEAELINQQDVHLSWNASASNDVIGYRLYRNNIQVNPVLITATNYQDLDLAEGAFTYWVVAEDAIGNLSLPSNTVVFKIDRTGPETNIQTPENQQIVSGEIAVIGTATSIDDFFKFELYYREQSEQLPGLLLSHSSLPVIGQQLAEINTTALIENATYIIRLEAQDLSQNTSVAEHSIVIDNMAPVAPINLTYQLSGGNDVQLNWNANNETDLAGYLVYRNGVIISGNGTIESSIITTTSYQDQDVVDGQHTYFVVATDIAGNTSDTSNSVVVNINTRVPDAYFTSPVDGHEFESEIRLVATSDDSDIASMLFEYSTDGSVWNPIMDDLSVPFDALFNPVDFGLSYGNIMLRVTATDNTAQVDPSPDQISVVYKDLTPPMSITGLFGLVTGNDIQLNWTANTEPDLAGYLVSRKRVQPNPEDGYTLLTFPYVTDNMFLDTGLAEGTYLYRISGIDNHDNQSEWVYSQELTVFSVTLNQPYSPMLTPADINIQGHSDYAGTVSGELNNDAGTMALNPTQVDASGQFVFESFSLEVGDNQIKVAQLTSDGHTSKDSNTTVQMSPIPETPINVLAAVTGFDLSFSWEAPDSNTIGYVPYINQQPFEPIEQLTENLTVLTSSNSYSANLTIDGDYDTYWAPSYTDRTNGIPVYIQVSFSEPKWIAQVEINWAELGNPNADEPSKYLLQYQSPVGWITQADFSGIDNSVVYYESDTPYLTQAIRIWMPLGENGGSYIALHELKISHQPFIDQLNYDSTLTDGSYDFQVSAINNFGFESELTTPQSLVVGDIVPPEAVTLMALVQNGNDVALEWSASSASDVAHYRVYRNGHFIYITPDAATLNYLDLNQPNGVHSYQVVAVDIAGNLSEYSNEAEVVINQQILDPPTGLMVSTVDSGQVLSLVWDEIVNPELSHYLLYRSLTSISGFELIGQSATTNYIDEGLINGTRYHYYVTAVDQSNNESLPSLVASGVPFDLFPPDQPVITKPTSSGFPVTVNSLTTDVWGYGSPAVEVDLFHQGFLVDTVTSSDHYIQTEIDINIDFGDIRYNSNNSHFAGYNYNTGDVTIVEPESESFIAINGTDLHDYFWNKSGSKIFAISDFGSQSELKSFGLDGEEISTLLSGFDISRAEISDDESKVFYWGDGLNPNTNNLEEGLWIYTIDSSTHQKIDISGSINLSHEAIAWLPNGDIAFINFPNGLYDEGQVWFYEVQSEQLNLIESNTAERSTLSISQGGSHLYYVTMINNNQSIKRYQLSNGDTISYNKPGTDVSMPVVKENIDQVFINFECCKKALIDITTGELLHYFEAIGDFNYFSSNIRITWLDDGRIMFLENGSVFFLNPPGIFVFSDIALTPGLNEFYAVARKSNGTSSLASDSIQVTLNESILADLEIKDSYLQLIPSQVYVNQSATGTVLVKNTSQVDVEQARLLIEVINPDFNTQLIAPAPLDFSLAAGETLAENFTIDNLDSLGEYTVRVFADSNQQVFETNENNNTVFKVIQVIDDLNADLELVLTSTKVFPGEDLQGMVRVYNPGTPFNGSVSIRITDDAGYAVGFEQTYPLVELNSGSTWEQVFNWNSADSFAGTYLVEATLYDQNQQSVQVQSESFTVSENAEFSLTLNTTAAQVPVGQDVRLLAEIKYLFGNVNQSGTLSWEIFDDAQQLIWTNTASISVMSPGFSGSFEKSWLASHTGSFQANVTLTTPLKTERATIPFEVEGAAAQLSLTGLINELSSGVILGQTWNSTYLIHNNGQIDVTNAPVKLSLWNSQLSQMLAQEITTISLPIGANTQLLKTWDSSDLTLDNYVLVLSVDLSAQGESGNYLLDTQTIQTIDITGPQIDMNNPIEQGYYSSNVEVRAVINDLHSSVDSVDIYLDANAEVSLQGHQVNNIYQYRLTDLSEGAHQLNVSATDSYGNVSNQSRTFNVDSIAPVIDITGISDGGLYNSSVQAHITITDINLSTSQIILDGVSYFSGTSIALEGSHILMVSATDLAGNSATERVPFNIDLTPPSVIISYPQNNSETNQNSTVLVGSTEVGAQVVLSSGTYSDTVYADFEGGFSFADVPLTSGQNVISVQATDLAGNLGQSTSVNVNQVDDIIVRGFLIAQSTYGIGEEMPIAWQITNLNDDAISQLQVELNLYSTHDNQLLLTDARNISIGAFETVEFESIFETENLSIGGHRIELQIQIDQIWQTLDVDLILLQDILGPELTVIEPTENQLTQGSVGLLVVASDLHSQVDEVSYRLGSDMNWFPLTFSGTTYEGQLELADGAHQIVFKAQDLFGNETHKPSIEFNVDSIGPEIVVNSPADGLITNQAVTIDYVVTDNHDFSVDAQLNQISISSGDSVTDEGAYELVISATDEVSNQSEVTKNFVIDTTAPIVIVTSPASDAQTTSDFIDIVGEAENKNIIKITINGVVSTLNTNSTGQFISTGHALQLGMNLIEVTAIDQAGNVSQPEIRQIDYIEVASVVGRIWQDDDQDTIIDSNELGFNQVSLRLTDSNNISLNIMTDSDGFYDFNDLSPGQYTIEVIESELLNEWINTTNNSPLEFDITANQNIVLNFGFYLPDANLSSTIDINHVKGRLLIWMDPATASYDSNGCQGVHDWVMSKSVSRSWHDQDIFWAKLYDDTGTLIQTEQISYADMQARSNNVIDEVPETTDVNLQLLSLNFGQLRARILAASNLSPPIIQNSYSLEMGINSVDGNLIWLGGLIEPVCETWNLFDVPVGDLILADVSLYPSVGSDDPNSMSQAPLLRQQKQQLIQLLDHQGWSYHISDDISDFETELNKGYYVAYILLSESPQLSAQIQLKLSSALQTGDGLFIASGIAQLQSKLESELGVQLEGYYSQANQLNITDSNIFEPGLLNLYHHEQVLKANITTGESVAEFIGLDVLPPADHAMIVNESGDGRSLFAGFDLLLQATGLSEVSYYQTIILDSIDYIQKIGQAYQLNRARMVRFSLQNIGRPVSGKVSVTLPTGVNLVATDISTTDTVNGFEFNYFIAENESSSFDFWLQVNASPVTVEFDVFIGTSTEVFEHTEIELIANQLPDLSAFISNCQSGIKPGETLIYRYEIENIGNIDINGALANTDFSTELSNPSWTCESLNGAVCPQQNGIGNLKSLQINLPVGGEMIFYMQTTVTGSFDNTAQVEASIILPQDSFDINPVNNMAEDVDDIYWYLFKNGFECSAPGELINKIQPVFITKGE